ncbi:uncharacterized protein EDB93DRAFT_1132425 [Suillus bovinus]|uniref:uncharacterized protein n=1 Tax=Suillus bovinus TaxID=48563 RepID=UPI001B87982A|nr:uncharacterized protein EDB93DRAFT_1132425 [Suillus bovinus]KAG2154459.1 hypothetical protein EDB93DRAFT_1132425 [Suillus bovinus]
MYSTYMWSISPPPNLPAKLRRKSSSASINTPSLFEPDDNDLDSPSPVTSPLPSSSPLSTPIYSSPPNHIATRYSYSRSQFQHSYEESHSEFDDAPGSPTPFYHRGRTSKYVAHQQVSDKYGSCPESEDEMVDSEPCHSDDLLSWLGPQCPARDVRKDIGYEPESMDIHLRRTYFATSSERGRWQSSPVIPQTYNAKPFISSPIRPHRGHSTPVKSITRDVKSPLLEFRDFVRRQSTSGVKVDPSSSPFLAASDSNDIEDYRSLSPLPPSSPPTSPMSLAPSQPDDCALIDDDMVLNNDFDPKQTNIHSSNVTPRDVSTSEAPLLLASEHALNAASSTCSSSCTNEATHQPLKLSLTVPAPINTITTTPTTKIEPLRSYPHSPTNSLLGLSAYTNIPSAVTPPPHLGDEEMGLVTRNTTSTGVVGVRTIVDAQVVQCDNTTSQSTQIRVSSVSAISADTNPVDPLPATSITIPNSPSKTVKKPRPSFSDGEFVQGSSISHPQPQTARRSNLMRTKSPENDIDLTPEPSRPQPESKSKQGLKREDSVSSITPAQKKPRLSENVDHDTDRVPRRKQRKRKTSSSAKEKITVRKSRSRSRSCLKSMSSEEDLRTQVARICDEPQVRNGSEVSVTKVESPVTNLAPLDPEQVEITGMLVEALATSRASSMDPLALHTAITQTHPHLKTKHNKKEWLNLIPAILEAGRERCGMFEKVQSSGTDGAKQARWFYVSDRDEDRERAGLLEELMPKQKRNETKKFKKYYYPPLQKVSRWDSEDAI